MLLSQLIDIYLHLNSDVLARAVAEDERSYNSELFNMSIKLMEKNGIKREVLMTIYNTEDTFETSHFVHCREVVLFSEV